jgi:hypothetical protein
MPHELDDILLPADCPNCGQVMHLTYKTLRLGRTVECQGCGVTVKFEDDTPLAEIQALIDKAQGR